MGFLYKYLLFCTIIIYSTERVGISLLLLQSTWPGLWFTQCIVSMRKLKQQAFTTAFSLSAWMLGFGELFVQIDFKSLSHKETPKLMFVYVCS